MGKQELKRKSGSLRTRKNAIFWVAERVERGGGDISEGSAPVVMILGNRSIRRGDRYRTRSWLPCLVSSTIVGKKLTTVNLINVNSKM